MKAKILQALIGAVFIFAAVAAGVAAEEQATAQHSPDTDDNINYSVGYQIGGDFKRQNIPMRRDSLLKGIEDAISGADARLTLGEMQALLAELKKRVVADQRARLEEYRGERRAFLAANAAKEGVVVLPSGLQYKVLREGSGAHPGADEIVRVNYRGTKIDGTEFDSSYRRGQAAELSVDKVIPGWSEALQLMRPGAKWQLFVPADQAYGERGPLADETVIFEVELLEIVTEQ